MKRTIVVYSREILPEGLTIHHDTDERLRATVSRLVSYLTAEFEGARAVESLTVSQLKVLRELSNGPMFMTQIARLTGVTRGAATGMVDKLVSMGLTARLEDPTNRRLVLVRLTPEGKTLQEHVHQRTLNRVRTVTRHLDDEESQSLDRMLAALARGLDEAAKDGEEMPPVERSAADLPAAAVSLLG